jgi:UDP-GlcNAc:undecaprenyl-phosphate GlcNAc-1-phosphate transferase
MIGSLAIESFLLAGVLALGLGRVCMSVALRMRWVDRPGHRKIHRRPVPYLGGLALFLAVGLTLGLALALAPWLGLNTLAGFSLPSLLACIWPAFAACLLGLWDDLFDLRPRYKFVGQAVFALVFSQYAYHFSGLHFPGFAPYIMGPEIAVLVTAFFIVAVANGYNMMDGSDALCLGASLVTLLLVAAVADMQGQPHLALLGLAAAGACLGLLFWNRPPARIYLGDAGSQGLGFLVACAILALDKGEPGNFASGIQNSLNPIHYRVVLACLMVGWPALEVFLTVARRVLQGRGLGVADQGHFHHRLARLGAGPRAIALTAMLVNLLCGGIVLAFMAGEKGIVVLLMLPLAALFTLGMQRLGYMRFFSRDWLDDRRPHYAIASHFAAMQTAKLKLARRSDEVLGLVEQTCREFGIHLCRLSLTDASDKRWSWNWNDAAQTPPHKVAWDRVRIPGTRNHASWSMEAHDEREPELSMNIRVVMVEFMRSALGRLGDLGGDNAIHFREIQGYAKGSKPMGTSAKGLKQRL